MTIQTTGWIVTVYIIAPYNKNKQQMKSSNTPQLCTVLIEATFPTRPNQLVITSII